MINRTDKLNKLLKQELSTLFVLDFPGEIITIDFIYTSTDLSEARVFVSVASEHQSVYDKLRAKTADYRRELSSKLYIRKMPKITIERDQKKESIEHIENILEKKR